MNKRTISSVIANEAKTFAMYTITSRAIPHMIDGLKPVQRFFLYSAIHNAKDFTKVAAISGRASELGYHHGETSAADAGQLMAAGWSNNYPIIEGRGNFGSRMVQQAASSRYTFCRIHENFNNIFKDVNVCPVHDDIEHLPPAYYLPVIPFVLLNGIKGIATGFATDILPHDVESVKNCVIEYISTGDIQNEPVVKFPEFDGKIRKEDTKMFLEGIYTVTGKTKLLITEIPYKFERESYIKILDDLEDSGTIVRYDDRCGKDNFEFEVTLKRDFLNLDEDDHEKIMKTFKLRQGISENITVIDWEGKLREYEKASDLIKDFVDHRITFIDKRIQNNIIEYTNKLSLANAKVIFIERILDGTIEMKGKTKKQAIEYIQDVPELGTHAPELVSMSIYSLTTDELNKLQKDVESFQKELTYWKATNCKKEYKKDLNKI